MLEFVCNCFLPTATSFYVLKRRGTFWKKKKCAVSFRNDYSLLLGRGISLLSIDFSRVTRRHCLSRCANWSAHCRPWASRWTWGWRFAKRRWNSCHWSDWEAECGTCGTGFDTCGHELATGREQGDCCASLKKVSVSCTFGALPTSCWYCRTVCGVWWYRNVDLQGPFARNEIRVSLRVLFIPSFSSLSTPFTVLSSSSTVVNSFARSRLPFNLFILQSLILMLLYLGYRREP